MIKCFFVDVKSITSDVPRSSFVESELDRLAANILAADGLLRPLIIREIAPEQYAVIEGHREYYAALKAKEKDINKAEMVNAFVVNANTEKLAIEQLKLLQDSTSTPSAAPAESRSTTAEIIDLLLPTLLSTIAQQLQPIVTQLNEQKQILESLRIDRQIASMIPTVTAVDKIELLPAPEPPIDVIPTTSSGKKKTEQTPKAPPVKEPKIPKTPKTPPPKATKATKTPKTPVPQSSPSPTNNVDNSFRSPRAIEAIDLIDKLSREQLTIRMERSGISKSGLNLIDNIIDERDSQASGKFHTWEAIVAAKIKGLGAVRIKEIIEKLK